MNAIYDIRFKNGRYVSFLDIKKAVDEARKNNIEEIKILDNSNVLTLKVESFPM